MRAGLSPPKKPHRENNREVQNLEGRPTLSCRMIGLLTTRLPLRQRQIASR